MTAKKKHFLFICAANMNRSPTARRQCQYLAEKINPALSCDSAGLFEVSNNPVNQNIIDNSDMVFVMEDYMKEHLLENFEIPESKIIVLDIADRYACDDGELSAILRQKLEPYIREI